MLDLLKRNENGFTLVELLVVVTVIGILVALAIINFRDVGDMVSDTAIQADLRAIENAADMIYLENRNSKEDVTDITLEEDKPIVDMVDGLSKTWDHYEWGANIEENEIEGELLDADGEVKTDFTIFDEQRDRVVFLYNSDVWDKIDEKSEWTTIPKLSNDDGS